MLANCLDKYCVIVCCHLLSNTFIVFCHIFEAIDLLCMTFRHANKSVHCKPTDTLKLSLVVRKPVFGDSDLVRHKPGCATTEDGYRLEISDLESRGILLSV